MRVIRNLGITIKLGMELIFYTIVRVLSIPMEKIEERTLSKKRSSKNSNGNELNSQREEEDILGI